jgi:HD superfamily phosphodiesterase
MSLTDNIQSAERLFIFPLENFFSGKYDEKSLPSHGLSHHTRVWKFAKELLPFAAPECRSDPGFIQKLLIASFMHDIGMSVEPGVKHGLHSRSMCEEFLQINNYDPSDYHDLLDTIHNHDNKEYSGSLNDNELLKILSVADDLDAFGYAGIYRYAEIYLIRGTGFVELGNMVLKNARKRFENFRRTFSKNTIFFEKQKRRYLLLDQFYTIYNKKIIRYQTGNSYLHGHCGLIELISISIMKKIPVNDILASDHRLTCDEFVNKFLESLENELSF